ncbi:DUF5955 family protein [Streptomyces cylindrosporus]|uniref:DUF5955 family protein n=1 Tax=Streptomyces cylindrosporus TaxID=2927583 RepID=A0ABS9YMU5_9ACTN|nr:DUF5955 family protein [Streptomyces cylindrosporus]MCI3278554.1 DUF5955 family protein [Streptomyces cylindrosporus]
MSDNRIVANNNSGQIVGGSNNQVSWSSGAPSADTVELQRRLDELQQLLARYAAALPNSGQLQDDTDELATQLRRDRPNRTVVRSLLTSLTAGASGVSAVAAAVQGVGQLVSRVLG